MTDIWTDDGLPALHYRVNELLSRYAHAVDRRDWELLRSLFHPNSRDEHGFSAGSVDEFIDSFSQRSAAVPEMLHLNGNVLIVERDAERKEVLVETSTVAWSRTLPEDVQPGSYYDSPVIDPDSTHARLATVANRYLDIMTEHDGALKFLFRRVIFEWVSVAEVPRERPFPPGLWTSTRDGSDPAYRTLAEFRAEYEAHLDRRS